MQKTCLVCGKIFTVSKKHPDVTCCSRKCGARNRFKHLKKDILVCEHCGKEFHVDHNPNTPTARFCSRKCYDTFRTESRPLCAHCGKRVPPANNTGDHRVRFCSQSCKVAHMKPKPKHCVNCGVFFSSIVFRNGRVVATTSHKTCSTKCHNEWIRNNPERKRKIGEAFAGARHPNWQGGKSAINLRVHRGSGWERLAEKARDRDGRVCMLCGKTEADNGRKMDVHHIVTYHDINNAKKANRLSNLISLCKSCHKKEEHKIQHQQIVLPFAAIAQADRRAARASAQA